MANFIDGVFKRPLFDCFGAEVGYNFYFEWVANFLFIKIISECTNLKEIFQRDKWMKNFFSPIFCQPE